MYEPFRGDQRTDKSVAYFREMKYVVIYSFVVYVKPLTLYQLIPLSRITTGEIGPQRSGASYAIRNLLSCYNRLLL